MVREAREKAATLARNLRVRGDLERQITARTEQRTAERAHALAEQRRLFHLDATYADSVRAARDAQKDRAREQCAALVKAREAKRVHELERGQREDDREEGYAYWRDQKALQTSVIADRKKERIDESGRARDAMSNGNFLVYSKNQEIIKKNFEVCVEIMP